MLAIRIKSSFFDSWDWGKLEDNPLKWSRSLRFEIRDIGKGFNNRLDKWKIESSSKPNRRERIIHKGIGRNDNELKVEA